MISFFEQLSKEDQEKLIDAIPMITILIAGSEGKIDTQETSWATKLTEIRSYAHYHKLHTFYQNVGLHFQEKLDKLILSLPEDVGIRTRILSDKLAELNDLLKRLRVEDGAMMYRSFTSFAKHVAKSSGGFLGFGSITNAEKKLIGLPMLTPIIHEFDEGEEEHK